MSPTLLEVTTRLSQTAIRAQARCQSDVHGSSAFSTTRLPSCQQFWVSLIFSADTIVPLTKNVFFSNRNTVNDFTKGMAQEVRYLLSEIGKLRDQRRQLQ